jgi:hypothetical protein
VFDAAPMPYGGFPALSGQKSELIGGKKKSNLSFQIRLNQYHQ